MADEPIITKTIRSQSHDPWYNLALEEYLLKHISDHEVILYLWQNNQTVVIGRNQNAWKECAWEQLEKDGGKLARRLSGGGAVFHDLGNLNFTFLVPRKHYNLEKQLSVILDALEKLGVDAEFSGRNDLLLDGKKFSGHAFYFQRHSALHHGTILIKSDLEKLGRYLQPSKKKMVSKGIESVRARVVNIAEISEGITVSAVMDSLEKSFAEIYGKPAVPAVIDHSDPEISANYAKYASWEWRFGQTPTFDIAVSERFSWGEIELGFRLHNGMIDSCTVYSDAMDEEFVRKIPWAMEGRLLKKDDMVCGLDTIAADENSDLMIRDLKKWLGEIQI